MTNLPPQQWIQSQDGAIIPRLVGVLVQLVFFTAVIALFGLSGVDELDAVEIDFLATGQRLADGLDNSDGTWNARLEAGFELPVDHPDRQTFRGAEEWRRAFSDSPAARWISGLLHYWAGEGKTVMQLANWLARLWILLASLLMANLVRQLVTQTDSEWWKTWVGLMGGLIFLALPGALSATVGAGALAFSAFVMTLFMSESIRYFKLEYEAWRLGLAWGLCLSVHPVGIFLLIPFLAVMFMRPNEQEGEAVAAGSIPLPSVSLGLFFVPVIGLFFFIAIWPALWAEPGRGLVAWFSETAWRSASPQQILGVDFDPNSGRAPHAWVGLLQWMSWTPLPLILACGAGLMVKRDVGRDGRWLSCLLLCTVVLVGGMNGGLFVGRNSLWPWCWAPTALLAVRGTLYVVDAVVGRLEGVGRRVSLVMLLAVVLIVPLGSAFARSSGGIVSYAGASERMPVPFAHLQQMAELTPEGTVHIASGFLGYRYAVGVLGESAGLALSWAERKNADWVIVVDAGTSDTQERMNRPWEGEQPVWEEAVAGVWMRAYRNGAKP